MRSCYEEEPAKRGRSQGSNSAAEPKPRFTISSKKYCCKPSRIQDEGLYPVPCRRQGELSHSGASYDRLRQDADLIWISALQHPPSYVNSSPSTASPPPPFEIYHHAETSPPNDRLKERPPQEDPRHAPINRRLPAARRLALRRRLLRAEAHEIPLLKLQALRGQMKRGQRVQRLAERDLSEELPLLKLQARQGRRAEGLAERHPIEEIHRLDLKIRKP